MRQALPGSSNYVASTDRQYQYFRAVTRLASVSIYGLASGLMKQLAVLRGRHFWQTLLHPLLEQEDQDDTKRMQTLRWQKLKRRAAPSPLGLIAARFSSLHRAAAKMLNVSYPHVLIIPNDLDMKQQPNVSPGLHETDNARFIQVYYKH